MPYAELLEELSPEIKHVCLLSIREYDIVFMKLNNAYEECARDRPCDRTTTCRKARCQSLTDGMNGLMETILSGTMGWFLALLHR